jgi:hypothetical protein
MSDFPCKFFIYTKGYETTMRITRSKHIDTYLNDIDTDISIVQVYKYNVFKYDDDDEEPELDIESAEYNPRQVIEGTILL